MSAPETRICELPGCDNHVERSNQGYCCKAHKQLAYRNRRDAESASKTVTKSEEVLGDQETVTPASEHSGETVELKKTAFNRRVSSSAKPCTRQGYPSGLFEAKDENGLPIFFDSDGERLSRVWGPNKISEVQLRQMKLEPTDLVFPGGKFYRRS